jgi:hypothetical protein
MGASSDLIFCIPQNWNNGMNNGWNNGGWNNGWGNNVSGLERSIY